MLKSSKYFKNLSTSIIETSEGFKRTLRIQISIGLNQPKSKKKKYFNLSQFFRQLLDFIDL